MHKIFDGVYVEENKDVRTYTLDADRSPHIKTFHSYENLEQKIESRQPDNTNDILNAVTNNNFEAKIDEDGLIHVHTDDPVHLVQVLCDEKYIEIEQATAIIAHEIENIQNPLMQMLLKGRRKLKEAREIIIQNHITAVQTGQAANNVLSGPNDKSKTR